MARKTKVQKTKVVAFKVEQELADFLDKLQNKSDFIRRAILAQFSMDCPLCHGGGIVPRGIHSHYKDVIPANNKIPCEKCATKVTVPLSLEGLSEADQKRLEQFYHGGPIYCSKCFPTVPACEDCAWHVPHEEMADHFKKVHGL
ncbi:MAG: hypothetical protein R3B84_23795 [Zavarzinella sp.]